MKLKFKSEDFELDTDLSEMGCVIELIDSNLRDKLISPNEEIEGELNISYIVEDYSSDTLGGMALPKVPIKLKLIDNKIEGQISLAYLEHFKQTNIFVDQWDEDYWDGDYDSAEEVLYTIYEETIDEAKKVIEDNLNKLFDVVED